MIRLLVADDDRLVLLVLGEGLRAAGFEVIEARDGLQALNLCRSEAPDLALLDIRMPGLDGLDLAERLRRETTVPFLFLSAYDDAPLVQRAVAAGALGYLIKPLDVAAIVPTIHAALARSREIGGLNHALASNRTIATAVGIIMQNRGVGREAAFDHLRQQARQQRRKVEDLALALIEKVDRESPRGSPG